MSIRVQVLISFQCQTASVSLTAPTIPVGSEFFPNKSLEFVNPSAFEWRLVAHLKFWATFFFVALKLISKNLKCCQNVHANKNGMDFWLTWLFVPGNCTAHGQWFVCNLVILVMVQSHRSNRSHRIDSVKWATFVTVWNCRCVVDCLNPVALAGICVAVLLGTIFSFALVDARAQNRKLDPLVHNGPVPCNGYLHHLQYIVVPILNI